jgi:hypothetical protein
LNLVKSAVKYSKIFISSRFVHFSPSLFSLPAQISPSGPTGHLSVGALQVYVSRFRKRKESKAAFAFFFPEQLSPPPPHDRTSRVPPCPPVTSSARNRVPLDLILFPFRTGRRPLLSPPKTEGVKAINGALRRRPFPSPHRLPSHPPAL